MNSKTMAQHLEVRRYGDFELTDADMEAITGLDRGEDGRTGPNPDQFAGQG